MSVFSNAWRECLREQYKTVIREDDRVTKRSLDTVMHQVGFTEDELKQLIVEATMHMDDVPDDFTPEINMFSPERPAMGAEEPFQPHPLECQCPSCMEEPLTPHDTDGQPIPAEDIDPERPDDDAPQQLSMF